MKNYMKITLLSAALFLVGLATPAHAEVNAGDAAGGALGLIALLILFILLTGAFAGLTLVWRGMFPRRVENSAEITRWRPWWAFWTGLAVTLILLAIVAIAAQAGEVGGPIILLVLIIFLPCYIAPGASAVVEWLGEMLDPSSTGLRRAILGSGAWLILVFVPILGWLTIAGLSFVATGSSIIGNHFTKPAAKQPVTDTPLAPPE